MGIDIWGETRVLRGIQLLSARRGRDFGVARRGMGRLKMKNGIAKNIV